MNEILSTFNLSPIGLVSGVVFIVLAVPLVIHLLNPNRGRLHYLGTLRFIKKIQSVRKISARIDQWFLLLLRLLLFFLISAALYGLSYKTTVHFDQNRSHYFSPAWLEAASVEELRALMKLRPNDYFYQLSDPEKKLTIDDVKAVIEKAKKVVVHDAAFHHAIQPYLQELIKAIAAEKNQPKAVVIHATDRLNELPFEVLKTNREIVWRIKKSGTQTQHLATSDSMQFHLLGVTQQSIESIEEESQWLKEVFNTVYNRKNRLSYQTISINEENVSSEKLLKTISAADAILWLDKQPPSKRLMKNVFSANDNGEVISVNQSWLTLEKNNDPQTLNSLLNSVNERLVSSQKYTSLQKIQESAYDNFQTSYNREFTLLNTSNVGNGGTDTDASVEIDIRSWLLLVASIIWLIERLVVSRQKHRKAKFEKFGGAS